VFLSVGLFLLGWIQPAKQDSGDHGARDRTG
jgi:hypothetical protein